MSKDVEFLNGVNPSLVIWVSAIGGILIGISTWELDLIGLFLKILFFVSGIILVAFANLSNGVKMGIKHQKALQEKDG